jgi:hypothetical protein
MARMKYRVISQFVTHFSYSLPSVGVANQIALYWDKKGGRQAEICQCRREIASMTSEPVVIRERDSAGPLQRPDVCWHEILSPADIDRRSQND